MKNATAALRSYVNSVLCPLSRMSHCGPRAFAMCATLVLLFGVPPASAHDLIQEQVVQVTMKVSGGALDVHLQVPVAVLAESTLPRTTAGALDTSNIAEPLRIVAADALRNLDVLQDGRALQQTAFSARLSADNTVVEAVASYATRADVGFSARLGTFTGTPQQPVRTQVDFTRQDGRHFVVSVPGPAARVDFDPSAASTVSRFAREMLQRLLNPGIHVLMLVCLLVPRRVRGVVPRLVGVMLTAQAVGLLASVTARGLTPAVATPAMLVAASAVVIAALQVIVQARLTLVKAVAALFGVCFGVGLGRGLVDHLQFAGAHPLLAVLAAAATALIAQAWAGGALWAARSWLDGRNLPAAAFATFVAVIAGHSALHQVVATANELAGRGTFVASHAATLVTLLWLAVALGVAALSSSRPDITAAGPPRIPRQSLS